MMKTMCWILLRSATATPDKGTVCGLLLASSLMLSTPSRAPSVIGWKLTLMVHPPFGGTWLGQLLVCSKSPLVETDDIFNEAFPVLVRLTGCGELKVPTVWFAKFRLVGES